MKRVWLRRLVALSGMALGACATVPDGRYGVHSLELEGVEQLDPFALRACMATRERESLSIDLSKAPVPSCGQPPFDARRIHVPLWRWPWTDWPLYDPTVFERDLSRIERWYRARGYYGASVLATESKPEIALYGTPSDEDEIELTIKVEEGEPILIRATQLEGISKLEDALGQDLLEELEALSPDARFDEAVFDLTKRRLVRKLRDAGYASAVVEGHVDIDPEEHTAAVRLAVVSGPFSEFGDVCVEGHNGLPAKLILQASDIVPGRPFSESDLEDARTRIYQMRVFSEVEIIAGRRDPRTGASQFTSSGGAREGEWIAFDDGDENSTDSDEQGGRVCRLSRTKGNRFQVPVEIRVKPGKLYRFGVGAGFQIGVEDGQRAVTAAQQWDVHLFTYVEVRNFVGGLRRFRIEERPRLTFLAPFPRVRAPDAEGGGDRGADMRLGNNLSMLLEWPAFLEPRTLLRITGEWDRGPDPFGGKFIRDDIDVGVGPTRDFLRNRLHASASLHVNPYIPRELFDENDASTPPSILDSERYNLLFLQQTFEWDTRDDRSSPHRGEYVRLDLQQTLPPSDWSYVRVIPEVREYVPLPFGLTLAGRAGIGLMHIMSSDAKTAELRRLGPRPYRLRGGGPYSVRGVQAGTLGLTDADDNGFPGGTKSWIASLELRVPLGDNFGVATFVDVGDVDGGTSDESAQFRFDRPNTTLGGGLRYKTIVGPVRLDVGWLVPRLQGDTSDSEGIDRKDPLFGFNGAVHLTIGEAF